jgi:aminoglycoside 2'-N-acetyltransferase I
MTRAAGGPNDTAPQAIGLTPGLRIAHTAELTTETMAALRSLLNATFDDFSDEAFDNALGGMHALLHDGDELIGHASVVQRRLFHAGRSFRTGYIEAVAVRQDRRREGHGGTMMAELERIVRAAYQLGALGASPDGARLYTARGWQRWQGQSSAVTLDGVHRTPDKDGWIYLLPLTEVLDPAAELTCDWRPGSPW